jgi:hypothetical protein
MQTATLFYQAFDLEAKAATGDSGYANTALPARGMSWEMRRLWP